ncbi:MULTISPECIES: hypothetical protein [Ensifer]|uniref:General stress protein 17M-like domain-containing protein n=1 Tax=Ensifer canadensis TaxID=555315 RepID=A0AAW4FXQ3_9HYPH|nr:MULTISPECIES: hypothetical protein [Ensifer]KQW61057.1 hypothetical protein ASD02_23280 [Ensifer sp. Root1252]KRC77962.1 hypothetical protein ASE32_27890 [Ensifer sp. Root231]KRD00382.1 hypothetical protein ASE47_23850 [Ensifer sp. Root258]MBM3096035.1 hypothetical protein [Ensifer canadensis]NOV20753.1 hypothetical protein [Ensifer canadensis]
MKTATGLFDDYSDALAAVGTLQDVGFTDEEISVVSSNAAERYPDNDNGVAEGAGTGAGLGALAGGAGGLLTGLGLMAIPGVGPVVAAGWLAATAAGAAAGAVVGGAAGGLIGALTGSGVAEDDAHVYAEGIRRGGTVVTVKTDESRVADAQNILQRSNLVDLARRRSDYREQGWTRFDDESDPFTQAEIEAERIRYRTGL